MWYAVKGKVTDEAVWGGAADLGDEEWQLSDLPSAVRSMSQDYLSLEDALRELSPCIIIMEK